MRPSFVQLSGIDLHSTEIVSDLYQCFWLATWTAQMTMKICQQCLAALAKKLIRDVSRASWKKSLALASEQYSIMKTWVPQFDAASKGSCFSSVITDSELFTRSLCGILRFGSYSSA